MQPLTKTFKAGTLLFRENDHSRELYIIQSGSVDVYRRIANQDVILAHLQKGAVLGEMALIDGRARSASVKATTDCTAIMIDSETFYDKTKGVPSWFLSLIRTTSQKIRKANQRLEGSFSQNVGPKIVLTLNYFVRQHLAQNKSGTPTLETRSTQTRIVQLLGITLQRVVSILGFLQTHGLITVNDNALTVRDPALLDAYCRFLRGYLKKSFEHMPPISADNKRFLTAMAVRYPELAAGTGPQEEITAEELAKSMSEAGVEEEFKTVADQFEQWGLLHMRKCDAGSDKGEGNPLAGYVFSFNAASWSRWYSYHQFQSMIPTV